LSIWSLLIDEAHPVAVWAVQTSWAIGAPWLRKSRRA